MADRYYGYDQGRFEQRYSPEERSGRGAARSRGYEPGRYEREGAGGSYGEPRRGTGYGRAEQGGYGESAGRGRYGREGRYGSSTEGYLERGVGYGYGPGYLADQYTGSDEELTGGGGYGREERGFDRGARLPGGAPRGRAEYGFDRPNLGSARSDYGERAYGGELDERGLGGEHERRHERGFFERAADEVSSWVGDEEAERRRRLDELRDEQRAGGYGRESSYSTQGEAARAERLGRGASFYDERAGVYGEGWRSSGPYTGRGPKGYRRSDERIREDVCERLTRDGEVDASEIEVSVNNGEVTLTGAVDHRQAKHLAEDIAESVSGVKDVHNQLRVNRQLEIERRGQQTNISQRAREGQQG